MIGYSASTVFTQEELQLWREVTYLVAALPEEPDLRCHELARAVQELFHPLSRTSVVDGKFGAVDHSWLTYGRGPKKRILDVYCVGRLPMVQLLDAVFWGLPHKVYVEGPPRQDIDDKVIQQLVRYFRTTPASFGERDLVRMMRSLEKKDR